MGIRDRVLWKRLERGDSDACVRLIDRHYRQVYRYLLGSCGDPETAADLTQSTFSKAWTARARFEGRSSLRTWLISIARNELLGHLRRSGRSVEIAERLDLRALPDPAPTVEERFDRRRDAERIRAAVETLPVPLREIVHLHYYSELSIREAARLLSIPTGTAKSRLNRALIRLREIDHETSRPRKAASVRR